MQTSTFMPQPASTALIGFMDIFLLLTRQFLLRLKAEADRQSCGLPSTFCGELHTTQVNHQHARALIVINSDTGDWTGRTDDTSDI